MRALLIAVVLLAGCDGAPGPAVATAPVVEPDRVEAEKACSAITGYRPGGADRLRAQEYADCVVAVVTKDASAAGESSDSNEGPALRGRTDSPA